MLKRLTLDNFTVFEHAKFEFGMLNVIHGENGTGKTHVLKALYAAICASIAGRTNDHIVGDDKSSKADEIHIAKQYKEVFGATSLSELIRPGALHCSLLIQGTTRANGFRCAFSIAGQPAGTIESLRNTVNMFEPAVYLPATALLHLDSSFVEYYDRFHSHFERTWRDGVRNLHAPVPRELGVAMQSVAAELTRESGLECSLDNGGTFLVSAGGSSPVHASLAAEGHRKLLSLLVLIRNRLIRPGTQLFIDEPEANLNPALLKVAAKAIVMLAQAGVQVFVATHSLFLTREIDIYMANNPNKLDARFFGLQREGAQVVVHQGPEVADAGDLVILDEELKQANEYIKLSWEAK
jgi:predicted ATPase